jgi:hypothetical protein
VNVSEHKIAHHTQDIWVEQHEEIESRNVEKKDENGRIRRGSV